MNISNDSSSQTLFRDIIDQLRHRKTQKLDKIKKNNTIKLRRLLKIIDSIAAILGVSGICIHYYLTQILFYNNPEYEITVTYNNLCYVNIILTSILSNTHTVLAIISRYIIKSKLLQIKKSDIEAEGFNSNLAFGLILEIIVCLIIALPKVDAEYKGTMRGENFLYHITDIIMIVSLLRSYLLIRLYEHYSKWTSFKSSIICKKYKTTASLFFAIKSDLKDRPFITIGVIMSFLVVLLGVATMQSEKSYDGKVEGMDQLTNNEWLIVITMSTVGYGDLFPTTHFGRFFCLLACISGMILVSAMVVALNLASEFDKDQSIAYLAIKANKREEEWLYSASNVIKTAFKAGKYSLSSTDKFKMILHLKRVIFKFKKKTQFNSIMDITSAQILYDLQNKLEKKLHATKSIIYEIPNFKQRCEKIRAQQELLDFNIEEVSKQQKFIFDQLGFNYVSRTDSMSN